MGKRHRLAAELRRIESLNLNYEHREIETPGNVTFAFEDGRAADAIGIFLKMAFQDYRRPVLIHNGRKAR